MKLGMPIMIEHSDIFECIRLAEKHQLDFIEINLSFPSYLPLNTDWNLATKIAKERGLFFTIHADEQLNPFDFNNKVSKCYCECMLETIRLAKNIGASVINMHLLKGTYVTLPDKVLFLNDIYIEKYLSKVSDFISECENEIGDSKTRIVIENVDSGPFTSFQIKALELFMDSPVFGLTFDVGHYECQKGRDRSVFEKFSNKIIHVHLHDSDGYHPHLALGDGRIEIEKITETLPSDVTYLLEVKNMDGILRSLEYLKMKGIS